MNEEQKLFYMELRKIQDFAIGKSLCKQIQYSETEDMLEDITYDVLYMVCEMIDGYRNNLIKYNIINLKSNSNINENISLHDWCEEFLRCTDVQSLKIRQEKLIVLQMERITNFDFFWRDIGNGTDIFVSECTKCSKIIAVYPSY